jgi:AraC-like DNA-binding protein
MTYCRVIPPAQLRRHIEAFSYWEEDTQPSDARVAIMSSRAMSIQIDLHDTELRWYDGETLSRRHVLKGVTLSGVQTKRFGIDSYQPKIVRVIFRPGGAYPFFAPPAADFRDTAISLEDIWGAEAEHLQQRLVQAPTQVDIFRILTEVLASAAARPLANHPAVSFALLQAEREPQRTSVASLAQAADLSRKRFIDLFTREVGMTPKLYLRMTRFERLLRDIFRHSSVHWAETAAEYGYFDQSHLIRDFHDFAGMTPTEYLARRGDWHDSARDTPNGA